MDIQLSADIAARHGLTREQLGWLVEQDLDRAFVVGSGGRLQPYLPVVDARRVDRAYAWDGIGRPWFLQAKGSGAPRSDGRRSWNIPAAHFAPYGRFQVIACPVDPASGRLLDPVWNIPASDLVRLAGHGFDAATGAVLDLTASPTGHDALSRYRTTLAKLWETLAPPAPQAPAPMLPAEFPSLHQEQGAFYELAQIVELLRGSEDDLLLFRPASDIAGRDLLIQLVDSPRALFLQIKGTGRLAERDSIKHLIRRRTFQPADDFWLGFYYYQPASNTFYPDCWLVPSLEFARRTADQRDATTLNFETQLSPDRDRWREFRHPIAEQSAVLREALRRL